MWILGAHCRRRARVTEHALLLLRLRLTGSSKIVLAFVPLWRARAFLQKSSARVVKPKFCGSPSWISGTPFSRRIVVSSSHRIGSFIFLISSRCHGISSLISTRVRGGNSRISGLRVIGGGASFKELSRFFSEDCALISGRVNSRNRIIRYGGKTSRNTWEDAIKDRKW
jgi:hypothetical protein